MPQYKKNVYVLSSIYQSSVDGFRNAVGNYWTGETFFPNYGDLKSRIKSPFMKKGRRRIDSFKIIPRSEKVKNLETFPFFETKHDFEIYADKNIYEDDTAWIRYVQGLCDTSVVYMDFCFDVENPIASGEIEVQNFSPSMVYEKVDFKYNYYSRLYELTTGNSGTKETILPNLYMFLLNKEDETNDRFFQALTAGGELEKSKIKSVRLGNKEEFPEYFEVFGRAQRGMAPEKIRKISSKSKNIIFDADTTEIMKKAEELSTSFPMQVNLEFASDAATEFTEVLSDSQLTTSLISYLSLLPKDPTPEQKEAFYIKTEPMERFFEETQQSDDFGPSQTTVGKASLDVNIIDIEQWMKKIAKNKKIVRTKNTSIIGEKSKADMPSVFEKMMYMIIFSGKLKTMIEKYHRSYTDISDGAKSYSETFCYKIEKFSENTGSEPIQTIWLPNSNRVDVIKYIDTQIKYGKRYTYRASAYQLVIGSNYRYCDINFPAEYDAPEPLGTIIDPNAAISEAEILDTPLGATGTTMSDLLERGSGFMSNFGAANQTTSGQAAQFSLAPPDSYSKKEYGKTDMDDEVQTNVPGSRLLRPFYVTSDKEIFNTKYANDLYVVARKRQSVNDEKYFKASLSVKVRPSIKIAEVPFFETNGTMSDNPPVPPEVTVIPYRGVKDKILFNLNTSVGEYEMKPVTFNRLEDIKVQEIRESKRLPPNSKITYRTDDRVEAFEIYRLESPPEKIEDFAGNLRKYLETDINSLTLQKASSASFIDSMNPNTDYYYTFRAVDIHGNVSNPTEVRKVRIVENDGAVYPLIEIYQMKKIIPQTTSKKCKKLLNIVPRSTQTLINMNKSDMGDGLSANNVKRVVLGQEESGLFGKKFKIRLTSQKTGKQIDLNINFNVDYKQI